MFKSVEGFYRNGKVELLEPIPGESQGRVIVTFVPHGGAVDLAALGIGPGEASDMRGRFLAFDEDWMRPEMDAYDEL